MLWGGSLSNCCVYQFHHGREMDPTTGIEPVSLPYQGSASPPMLGRNENGSTGQMGPADRRRMKAPLFPV